MNIVLFKAEEVLAGRVSVVDRRAKHIVKVLGSNVGDRLRVGIINGRMGQGRIISISRKPPFMVELLLELTKVPESKPTIDLLLALPRPIMLKRIFSQATALGVGRFYLIHAKRVEKSFWNGSILKKEQYQKQLIQGLEQAVDTTLPEVIVHQRFKPFAEDVLPEIKKEYSHLLLAHPGVNNTLVDTITEKPEKVLLAVGPEGGWLEYELNKFKGQGFKSFAIGERILKVDTAVIALHSQVSLAREFLAGSAKVASRPKS